MESRLPVIVLPKTRSSSRPHPGAVPTRAQETQTHTLETRGAPQSRESDNEDAGNSRFLPRWPVVVAAGAACALTTAGTSTLLSRSPTYVPRVSLNSKIFLMSSACFFHEELFSPFSRAMADKGGVCGGRRGGLAGARGAGVGALKRGRPARGAQAAAAASLSGRAGAGARGCSAREPEETLCCGRASSSAVSSFTLAAAAVPPWLLFLLVSGTDFLPPRLALLLCRRLPASLSATFLPPFSSLPAARFAPSPSSPSSSSRGLPALPALPGSLPPPRLRRAAAFGDVLPGSAVHRARGTAVGWPLHASWSPEEGRCRGPWQVQGAGVSAGGPQSLKVLY